MNSEQEQRTRDDLTEEVLNKVLAASGPTMTSSQIAALKQQIQYSLSRYSLDENESNTSIIDAQTENARVLRMFIDAKRIEGRSDTTLYNYSKEMSKLFLSLNKSYKYITSKDIREYMAWRKDVGNLSPASLANMRQYMMSFFKWCAREELITKNPMDKIGVVKLDQHVIQVLSDEEQEIIRCACENERDRAIVDLLSGSGMRVSELVGLNRADVNLQKKQCKVWGKGGRERICFLTARCKVHLEWYLESRTDDNPALFVTTKKPYSRLTKNGIEYILREIAKKSKIPTIRLYPHKFRSTLGSNMYAKGADLTSIQGVIGHKLGSSVPMQHYVRTGTEQFQNVHTRFVD